MTQVCECTSGTSILVMPGMYMVYTMYMYIWNSDMHYRNRLFSVYRLGRGTYQYVLSTDQYRKSLLVQTSTYRYVLSMYQNNVMYVRH
jgi:hypothetical protein